MTITALTKFVTFFSSHDIIRGFTLVDIDTDQRSSDPSVSVFVLICCPAIMTASPYHQEPAEVTMSSLQDGGRACKPAHGLN